MSMSDSSIVDLEKMLPSSGSAHAVAGVPDKQFHCWFLRWIGFILQVTAYGSLVIKVDKSMLKYVKLT